MMVYEIPEQNFEKLVERFDAMVNRARKCKTVAPTFSVIHEADETSTDDEGITHTQRYLYVTLEGELPKVGGWEFVATIDHTNETGNIIRGVPGMGDVPVSFRTSAPLCAHCGHIRQRHETFVLRKGGEFKQVGRNCLADFFAGELADYVVSLTELWESLGEMMDSMGGFDEGGLKTQTRHPSLFILVLVQEVIGECGWLSKTKARELAETSDHTPPATADIISSMLVPPQYRSTFTNELWATIKEKRAARDEVDTTLETTAENALEWARSFDPEDEATNDYLYNLHTIAKGESVDDKGLGLLCSLIPAYKRVTEAQKEREAKPTSHHVGTVGERQVFENLTVEWVGQPTYSQWGATTPIKFVDPDGNVIMNWCSGETDYVVGQKTSIVGTVKSHDRYRDVAQTVVNRIKEWDGKPLKKAKKK